MSARLDELGGANAELRAINEELQSANESLLASREELRSLNAELQAINAELADRLAMLANQHDETARLLASTRIAILLLDNGGRIRSFTPRASEMFALTDTDLARPIAALGMRIPYGELEHDLDHLPHAPAGVIERRVLLATGRACTVRVLAHHSPDGFTMGTVFTFLEIA